MAAAARLRLITQTGAGRPDAHLVNDCGDAVDAVIVYERLELQRVQVLDVHVAAADMLCAEPLGLRGHLGLEQRDEGGLFAGIHGVSSSHLS